MATLIASHFTDELEDWRGLIAFYIDEVTATGLKLSEVIERNSIPRIAEKVEEHQMALNTCIKKFKRLRRAIREQQARLGKNHQSIEDVSITASLYEKQQELRDQMLANEKEYLDAKYSCASFLSGTLMRLKMP